MPVSITGRRATGTGLALLAIALLALESALSQRLDAPPRARGPARYDVPPKAMVEAMATGYDDVLADAFWIQFLQYDGTTLTENLLTRRWNGLQRGLDLITGLDPHFGEAYLFGSWVLGDAGHPHQAERLVMAGLAADRRYPSFAPQPRYAFQLGFIRFLDLHDLVGAAAAFRQAALLASRPPYQDVRLAQLATTMEAGMAERSHDDRLAIQVWSFLYRQAVAAKDLRMEAIASRSLARLGVPPVPGSRR